MTQQEVDNDQAGFLNAIFPDGDPFHPSRFPKGSDFRNYLEKQKKKYSSGGLESSRSYFIDFSDE